MTIQKFTPSLQTPQGPVNPVATNPNGLRSAAFQSESRPIRSVTMARCPSKATPAGTNNPLPVNVARTTPVEGRITETVPSPLGDQMFDPSKAGLWGVDPTVTVWRTAPVESSLKSLPWPRSATQMFDPSKVR